ncbi:MAG TPA: imidazole glycerol phosphate synthase subunit HisH [Microscillaceae bacterium]|nr:imidazole glycerol phosphate synthase subunit HisH [Microscillaceae bacterium]
MQVAILRYNAGNTQSVRHALERLGVTPLITDDPDKLASADKVIFPGVGHAHSAMAYLKSKNLDQLIPQFKQPFLGICLGMQLLCAHSEEGDTTCLGVFPIEVVKFDRFVNEQTNGYKVPHMGWNNLQEMKGTLTKGLTEADYMYFVHSYFVELSEHTSAQSDHIIPFSAMIEKDNFYAAQFHPEKSSQQGSKIIQNFLEI